MTVPPPIARSVLVVAPHPDDETLGCGAALAALAARGARLAVAFVTDGAASHPNSQAVPPHRMAALRAAEADAALSALGAKRAARLRLGLPDAGMTRGAAWLRARLRLARFAAAHRPDLMLLPWRRDPHRDHRDAHALASEALRAARLAPRRLEYAIWLDAFGRRRDAPRLGEMVRRESGARRWRRRKRAALAQHRSQLGLVVPDDPAGFALSPVDVERLCGPTERLYAPVR